MSSISLLKDNRSIGQGPLDDYQACFIDFLNRRPVLKSTQRVCPLFSRFSSLSIEKIASKLHLKQAYISRLEKKGTDHLMSTYEKIARLLHSKIVLVPENARVISGHVGNPAY